MYCTANLLPWILLQGEKDWQKYETARKLKVISVMQYLWFLTVWNQYKFNHMTPESLIKVTRMNNSKWT